MKRRVFVGSSKEARPFARAIQALLHYDDILVNVWNENVFELSHGFLGSLLAQLARTDFAVFVLAADDCANIRGNEVAVVRDNVLFELGLSIGMLGRERVFFAFPKSAADFHIPADLLGVVAGTYDSAAQSVQDRMSSMGPFCTMLQERVAASDPVATSREVFSDIVEEMRRLLSRHLSTQYVGPFPDFFAGSVCSCLERAKTEILIACDYPNYGSFTLSSASDRFFDIVEAKIASGVSVKVVVLDDDGRKSLNREQFASTDEQWEALKRQSSFALKIRRFEMHLGYKIDSLGGFLTALAATQDAALESLGEACNGNVVELPILMPIYLWVVDDNCAVFSIPTFGHDASEHGFETRDSNMVQALRSIWHRYHNVATWPCGR